MPGRFNQALIATALGTVLTAAAFCAPAWSANNTEAEIVRLQLDEWQRDAAARRIAAILCFGLAGAKVVEVVVKAAQEAQLTNRNPALTINFGTLVEAATLVTAGVIALPNAGDDARRRKLDTELRQLEH